FHARGSRARACGAAARPVPDDRFADLGREPEKRKSAAERFAELDERSPEPEPQRPREPARPGGRYGWVVGVAFIIVVVVAGANALRNSGEGYQGVPAGELLPPFAAPLAIGGPDGKDVNIAPKKACNVRGPGVFNVCDARAEPLAITFVANATRGCEDQLDRVERVRREFPEVGFVGVVSRRERDEAEDLVRDNGWGFPVAVDPDAALFNLYGIGDCPTTVFARRGGVANRSLRGDLTEQRLRTELRAIDR
nr:redoxin domain-containing protein [Actinomycetota bacterium]